MTLGICAGLGAMEAAGEGGVGLAVMLPVDQPGPGSADSEKGPGRSADPEKVGERGPPSTEGVSYW